MVDLTQQEKDRIIHDLVELAQRTNSPQLQQDIKRTGGLVSGMPGYEPQVPWEVKEKKFRNIFYGPNGLRRAAWVLKKPLKIMNDYVSVCRKAMLVDPITVGEPPLYGKDFPEFASVKIGARGAPPQVEAKARFVLFPTWELATDDKVDYGEIAVSVFPAFDRSKERVAIANAIGEDLEFFRLLEAASAISPNTPVVASSMTRTLLAKLWGIILGNQLTPGAYIMHPINACDMLTWKSDDLDQVTLNAIITQGLMGSIFGVPLLVSTKMKRNKIFCVTTKSKLGRMPERMVFDLKIFDNVPRKRFDLLGYEILGMGIHNTYGVCEGDIQ